MKMTLRVKLFATSFVLVIPLAYALVSLALVYKSNLDFTSKELLGLEATAPVNEARYLLQQWRDQPELAESLSKATKAFTALGSRSEVRSALDLNKEHLQQAGVPWNQINTLESRVEFLLSGNPETYQKVFDLTSTLLAYMGDSSNLILDPDINSYYLINTILNIMPRTLIYLDQLDQAISEWPATPTPQEYLKVYGLIAKFQASASEIEASLNRSLKDDPGPYGSIPGWVEAGESLKQTLLKSVQATDLAVVGQARVGVFNLEELDPTFRDLEKQLQKGSAVARTYLKVMLDSRAASLTRQLVVVIVSSSVMVAIGFALILFMVGRIRRQVFLQMAAFERVSQGDLTVRLTPKGSDELARSAQAFNRFMESFQTNFRNMTNLSRILGNSAERVQTSSEFLGKGSQTQAATVEETSTTMETFSDTLEGIRIHMARQLDNTSETFSTMDALTSGLDNIRSEVTALMNIATESLESTRAGETILRQSLETSQALGTGMNDANGRMLTIRSGTLSIAEMLSAISEISSNTNLLAMNAAIEAAHAGETGKGFAVVADEIRKLANDTQTFVDDITAVVEQIRSNVEAGALITENGDQNAQQSFQLGEQSREALHKISSSFEDIFSRVGGIVEFVQNTQILTAEIHTKAQALSEETAALNQSIEETTDGARQIGIAMIDLADSAQTTAQNGETLNQLSLTLEQQSDQLNKTVTRYKIEDASDEELESI